MKKTPRKTPSKDSAKWVTCSRCSALHSTEDEAKHGIVCSVEGQSDDITQNSKPSHSLIRNNRLTAPIQLMHGDRYHDGWIGNFVFLHPETMIAIGSSEMALEKPVILDDRFGFRMFPDTDVPLTTVGCYEKALDRLEKTAGEWLTLATATEHKEPAKRIHMQFTEALPPQIRRELDMERFKDDFFLHNDYRLFYVGEKVKFQFLNNEFSMIVRYIKAGSTDREATDDHSTSNLIKSFSQMEITSTGEKGLKTDATTIPKMFFRLVHSYTHLVITYAEPCITLDSFGGYSSWKTKVLHWVEEVLEDPPQYLGRGPVLTLRLVLLIGLPGVGKTMFVRALANTCHVFLFVITPEMIQDTSSVFPLAEQIIREAPCIVFFDNLDVICPLNETEAAHNATLLINLLLEKDDRICIFGATSKIEDVHKYVQQSGHFDRRQTIDLPTTDDKIEILNCLLRSVKHSLTEEDIKELATRARHFSGLDLSCLCDKAEACAKSRLANQTFPTSASSPSSSLLMIDFLECLPKIEPHVLKTLYQEMPFLKRVELKWTWDDIVGLRDIQQYGYLCTRHRIDHPEYYERRPQLSHLNGLLLFGPSGCSKTVVAKAIANDWQFNFFFVEGNALAGKYVGSTEANIEKLFIRARELAPTLIFFDNVENLAMKRNCDGRIGANNRALNQMLVELDRNKEDSDDMVAVIAATSKPELLDPAFYRCGRFDKVVYITLPDDTARRELLLRKATLAADIRLEELVRQTEGYSYAEITELVETAKLEQDEAGALCMDHLEMAFRKIQPKATPEQIAILDEFDLQHSH